MTDSYQQEEPIYKALYEQWKQPVINYGKDVERIEALEAIKKYKPTTVLGCWVTHKYDPKYPNLGGNEVGIEETKFADLGVKKYIFVGNQDVHLSKIIFHKKYYKNIELFANRNIISRAKNPENNFIAVIHL